MVVDFGQRLVSTHRLSDLARASPPGPAHRADRHVVVLITAGAGSYGIDFVPYACRPGTLLWARPGQVHQFGRQTGLDATLVAFRPAAVDHLPALRHVIAGPAVATHCQLAGEDEDAVLSEVTQLDTDCARYAGAPVGAGSDLLCHQLAVLLLRIGTLVPPHPVGAPSELLDRLHRELADGVAHRPVATYAGRLGCSVRTLTRACLAVTGRTAKQVIDEWVALEARRLLATTDLPVARVGRLLGFHEPTNFGRFFVRETGQAPGAFRATVARSRPEPQPGHRRSALPGRLGGYPPTG